MATVGEAFKDLISALLGISTFSPDPLPGPELGDEVVNSARRSLGGRLEPIPEVRLRWYPPDIERAQMRAQTGDMTVVGQLCESAKLDGVVRGLGDARTSVVYFPKRFYGSQEVIDTLLAKNASDRDVYNEMVPASEAALMAFDELFCGVAVGEMVPVQGRDFPVLVRRYPQNLWYLWSRNTWYYRSIVGLIPIKPGIPDEKGNSWVLHIGGGRLSPWNNGLWNTLGRSYINKTQTVFARQSYEMKHSHPARVAHSPVGAAEEERRGMLAAIIRWALNAAFALPPGWDIKLVESNGRGIEIYEQSIRHYNEEIATALCGSAVMLQGTAGFSNMDQFAVVARHLMTRTSSGWDHTVNTQILPAYIGRRWGTDALKNATTIETEVAEPKDRKQQGETMVALANAIKGLVEAIAAAQIAAGMKTELVALNVRELLASFGVPVQGVTEIVTVATSGTNSSQDAPAAAAPSSEAAPAPAPPSSGQLPDVSDPDDDDE